MGNWKFKEDGFTLFCRNTETKEKRNITPSLNWNSPDEGLDQEVIDKCNEYFTQEIKDAYYASLPEQEVITPPTNDQILDNEFKHNKAFKALTECVRKGTLAGAAKADAKAIIKAEM